jgi:hypothetical protein
MSPWAAYWVKISSSATGAPEWEMESAGEEGMSEVGGVMRPSLAQAPPSNLARSPSALPSHPPLPIVTHAKFRRDAAHRDTPPSLLPSHFKYATMAFAQALKGHTLATRMVGCMRRAQRSVRVVSARAVLEERGEEEGYEEA